MRFSVGVPSGTTVIQEVSYVLKRVMGYRIYSVPYDSQMLNLAVFDLIDEVRNLLNHTMTGG